MNHILQEKIELVLSYFTNNKCGIGQGGYILRGKFQGIPYEEKKYYIVTINILLYNKFISNESSFFKLEQNGFDYLYGDEEFEISIPPLSELIQFDEIKGKGSDYIFNELWFLIGRKDTALFYLEGPEYYNAIKKFIPGTFPSYSEYLRDRSERGASTSRISWYRELFKSLGIPQLKLFIDNLTVTINKKLRIKDTRSESGLTMYNSRIEIVDTYSSVDSVNEVEHQPLKIFISYAWDEHQETVRNIARRLQNEGFDVHIDIDVPYGGDLVQYMNNEIRDCDKCLTFLTPKYKEKAESAIGGVAHESRVISREIYNNQDTTKFIPVLLTGSFVTSCPDFISGRKGFNFVENSFEEEIVKMVSEFRRY